MSSVARMDQAGPAAGLTGYYAAHGTPPGRFLGAGLAGLDNGAGVEAGSVVTEEQLWRMLGMLQDPVTGQPLGQPPAPPRTQFIDRLGRVRPAPKTVAGFDLTFSPPKSVSVAWALADDADPGTDPGRAPAGHRAGHPVCRAAGLRHPGGCRRGGLGGRPRGGGDGVRALGLAGR